MTTASTSPSSSTTSHTFARSAARSTFSSTTAPSTTCGPFDLLVDYGTLDDLDDRGRGAYVHEVVALTRPGTRILLWCFEWTLTPWERVTTAILPFGGLALAPGEVTARFGNQFEINYIAGEQHLRGWPRGWAAYLMTRRNA